MQNPHPLVLLCFSWILVIPSVAFGTPPAEPVEKVGSARAAILQAVISASRAVQHGLRSPRSVLVRVVTLPAVPTASRAPVRVTRSKKWALVQVGIIPAEAIVFSLPRRAVQPASLNRAHSRK